MRMGGLITAVSVLATTACASPAHRGAWAYSGADTWFGVSLEDENKCRLGLLVRPPGAAGAAGGGYWCNYSVEAEVVRIHQARDPTTGAVGPLPRPIILSIAKDGIYLEVQSAGEHNPGGSLK